MNLAWLRPCLMLDGSGLIARPRGRRGACPAMLGRSHGSEASMRATVLQRRGHRRQQGTWCSGITPAQHAGGPGFNPQCVHFHMPFCWSPGRLALGSAEAHPHRRAWPPRPAVKARERGKRKGHGQGVREKEGPGRARPARAGPSRARPGLGRAGQSRAGLGQSRPDRAGPNRAGPLAGLGPGRANPSRAGPSRKRDRVRERE